VKKRDSPYVAPVNTKKETKKLLSEEEKAQLVREMKKHSSTKRKENSRRQRAHFVSC